MTYAQYAALVDGHNTMHGAAAKRRRRGRVDHATHGDIAALKEVKVASG